MVFRSGLSRTRTLALEQEVKNDSWLDPVLALILWLHLEDKKSHERAMEEQRKLIPERWWERRS